MFTILIQKRAANSAAWCSTSPRSRSAACKAMTSSFRKGNVSKRHARIVLKDGKFIIVDLKSTNGTYVNGRKITSPLVVKDSDKIYIGDFIVGVDEAASERGRWSVRDHRRRRLPKRAGAPPPTCVRPSDRSAADGFTSDCMNTRIRSSRRLSRRPFAGPPAPRTGGGSSRHAVAQPGPPIAPREPPEPRAMPPIAARWMRRAAAALGGRPGGTMPAAMAPIPPPQMGRRRRWMRWPPPMGCPAPGPRRCRLRCPHRWRSLRPWARHRCAEANANGAPRAGRAAPGRQEARAATSSAPRQARRRALGLAAAAAAASTSIRSIEGREDARPAVEHPRAAAREARPRQDPDGAPPRGGSLAARPSAPTIDLVETLETSGELPKYIDQDTLIKETLSRRSPSGPLEDLLAGREDRQIIIESSRSRGRPARTACCVVRARHSRPMTCRARRQAPGREAGADR